MAQTPMAIYRSWPDRLQYDAKPPTGNVCGTITLVGDM